MSILRPASGRRAAVTMLAAAGLLLAACGGDDDETSDATVSPSAAGAPATTVGGSEPATSTGGTAPAGTAGANGATEEDFVATGAAELNLGDPEVDRCITQATIDAIGFENIQATGVTPEELFTGGLADQQLDIPADQHQALREQIAGCGDLVELFTASQGASETDIACAREHLSNDFIAELFVSRLTNTEPSAEFQATSDTMTACVTETTAGG